MIKKAIASYIGRFSPCHNGHLNVVRLGLSKYERMLIIIGSCNQARTPRDPFTGPERKAMLEGAIIEQLGADALARITFAFAEDFPYNDTLWLNQINKLIDVEQAKFPGYSMYLTGADRDKSTFYLKMFPQLTKDLIEYDETISLELSSTMIRDLIFGSIFKGNKVDDTTVEMLKLAFLPISVRKALVEFSKTEEFAIIKEEYKSTARYKERWKAAPYAPTFVTVDSVVTQGGHILLVQRRNSPGKGLWALPGGFLDQDERLLDGAIRELREESGLKVPAPVLKGSLKGKEVFDKPDRSLRGRTVTVAYRFELTEQDELPKVRGRDDAKKAEWIQLSRLHEMKHMFFEDHYHIIDTMVMGSL